MNSFKIGLLGLTLACIIVSCGDSDTLLPPIDTIPQPAEKVFATINGVILDEDGQSLEASLVNIEEQSTTTDVNGYFSLEGFFDSEGALITVSKEGFFDGVGLIIPYVDVSVQTTITLVENVKIERGLSAEMITVEASGFRVEMEENSFSSAIGTMYDGVVSTATDHSWPTDPDFNSKFPGYAKTVEDGRSKILDVFAVLNLELYTDSGDDLEITKPAKVSIKIDPSKLNEAPDEIDMWFLNTETGLWEKEGKATLSGEYYEATLNHFTSWCPAQDYETINLSGNIIRAGAPHSDAIMGINYGNWRVPFRSASDGSYSTSVAQGFDFDLDVRNRCAEELYLSSFSASDMDLTHDIDIAMAANDITVSGQVACPPDNVATTSYVLFRLDSWFTQVLIPNASGEFSYTFEDCNQAEVSVTAYDQVNSKSSETIIVSGNTTDLTLNVCEEEFLGSVTIERDGEAPYVIGDCRMTRKDIFDQQPFLGADYRLESVDNYGGGGEFANYSWIHIVTNDPDADLPRPPGPLVAPASSSSSPPFYYRFDLTNAEVLEENDDIVKIKITPQFPIAKIENGTETNLPGTITFEAIKP